MSQKARPDGVTLIALWYYVLAGGALFAGCVTTVPMGLISMSDMPTGGRLLTSLLLGFGLSITVIVGATCGLVGWGLWNRAAWARMAALVLAIMHLPFFPVGTTIGIGSLWYLSSHPEAKAAFTRPAS